MKYTKCILLYFLLLFNINTSFSNIVSEKNYEKYKIVFDLDFDKNFYAQPVDQRIKFKLDLEEIATKMVNSKKFEDLYIIIPENYFKLVTINKIYYKKYKKTLYKQNNKKHNLEVIISEKIKNLDYLKNQIKKLVISFDYKNTIIDNYSAELILELLAEDKKFNNNIISFFANNTSLTKIPENLYKFPNLKNIIILNSNISEIPSEICGFTSLTTLNLSYNPITKFGENIEETFPYLENLFLYKKSSEILNITTLKEKLSSKCFRIECNY